MFFALIWGILIIILKTAYPPVLIISLIGIALNQNIITKWGPLRMTELAARVADFLLTNL